MEIDKFLSEIVDCSCDNDDVMGRRGNCSVVFGSWSKADVLFSETATDAGTSGGGTCEIGCGNGELWVIGAIWSWFLTICDEVVDGIKEGGGQWGGRCCMTGGVLEWTDWGTVGDETLTGGDKKWDLVGGDFTGVSVSGNGLTSTSAIGGAGLLTSVSTEWGVLGGDEELRSSCKEQTEYSCRTHNQKHVF